MQRTRIEKRPLEEKERFFTNLFIRRGMDSSDIAYCERRACLKPGEGQEVLKRESVQQRIKDAQDLILDTQNRQRSWADTAAIKNVTPRAPKITE